MTYYMLLLVFTSVSEIQHVLTLKIDVSSNVSSYVLSAVVLRPHHHKRWDGGREISVNLFKRNIRTLLVGT